MSTALVEFPNLTKGLQIPDASAEMAQGSLGVATNCDLTKSGTIKQRYGTAAADEQIAKIKYAFIHDNAGTPQLCIMRSSGIVSLYGGNGTTLTLEDTASSGPTNATGSAQMLRSALSTDNPNTYVASPSTVLYRWDGSAWATVLNSPKCRYVVQAGWAERLLYCGFDAGATNGPNGTPVDKSIVGVSNPSEPEVYTTTDTTSIAPGDGEDIMGAVTYNGQTFVFKKMSFFVFYGESGSGGSLELLYNQRSGVGMAAPGCVTVGPDGVYFLADDGIYRTTGGTATCISDQINGIFTGDLPSWTPYDRNLNSPDTPLAKFATAGDKIYCAVSNYPFTSFDETDGTESCSVILVYDTTMQAWIGYYDYPAASLLAMPWPDLSFPLVVGVAPDPAIQTGITYTPFVFHPLLSGDLGEDNPVYPVVAQLNWFQTPDARGYVGLDQAAIHRADLWGSGTFDVATVIDYQRDAQTSKEVDFGDSNPSLADVWGDGTVVTDVWGDGSDATDVWGAGTGSETDLIRLYPPTHKYLFAPKGRGNYLAIRFSKTATSSYAYLNPPRVTLQSR